MHVEETLVTISQQHIQHMICYTIHIQLMMDIDSMNYGRINVQYLQERDTNLYVG